MNLLAEYKEAIFGLQFDIANKINNSINKVINALDKEHIEKISFAYVDNVVWVSIKPNDGKEFEYDLTNITSLINEGKTTIFYENNNGEQVEKDIPIDLTKIDMVEIESIDECFDKMAEDFGTSFNDLFEKYINSNNQFKSNKY